MTSPEDPTLHQSTDAVPASEPSTEEEIMQLGRSTVDEIVERDTVPDGYEKVTSGQEVDRTIAIKESAGDPDESPVISRVKSAGSANPKSIKITRNLRGEIEGRETYIQIFEHADATLSMQVTQTVFVQGRSQLDIVSDSVRKTDLTKKVVGQIKTKFPPPA